MLNLKTVVSAVVFSLLAIAPVSAQNAEGVTKVCYGKCAGKITTHFVNVPLSASTQCRLSLLKDEFQYGIELNMVEKKTYKTNQPYLALMFEMYKLKAPDEGRLYPQPIFVSNIAAKDMTTDDYTAFLAYRLEKFFQKKGISQEKCNVAPAECMHFDAKAKKMIQMPCRQWENFQ